MTFDQYAQFHFLYFFGFCILITGTIIYTARATHRTDENSTDNSQAPDCETDLERGALFVHKRILRAVDAFALRKLGERRCE